MFGLSGATAFVEMALAWEHVLGRHCIKLDDNFYLLGGDRVSADRLFAEIEARSGRVFPSALIDYAPTIALLCARLEQNEASNRSPLVLMKPGQGIAPVFLVHGLGGSIGELYEVVSHIDTSGAVYGIEGRGVDGMEEPLKSIEEMATLYLGEVERVHPDGPYFLIGYSLGGLVAFEMARRLRLAGKCVGLLTLVDATILGPYLSATQRLDLIWRRMQYHCHEMRGLPFPAPLRYIKRRAAIRLGLVPDPQQLARRAAERRPLSFECAWNRAADIGYSAIRKYRPSPYHGVVRYVTAIGGSFFLPRNPATNWKPFVSDLDIEETPGDHVGLIHSGAPALGAILTRHIREATGESLQIVRSA